MAFFEHRLDERISYGARGGPVFKTRRVRTNSGRRVVNRDWTYPLHRYQVAQAVKTNDDFEAVRAFFYVVAGAYDGFRFKDWGDYRLTQSNSRLVQASGSPSEWQINRVYSIGSREFLRPIYKPCASPAAVIYRTRSGATSVATATVSTTDGIVQPVGHLAGDTYTVVGEFDVPVAFEDDELPAEIVDADGDGFLMGWSSLVLEEVRL